MRLRWENPEVLPLMRETAVQPVNSPWLPGDTCRAWQDNKSRGLVVGVDSDERLLVLWSAPPFAAVEGVDLEVMQRAFDAGLISARALKKWVGFDPEEKPDVAA